MDCITHAVVEFIWKHCVPVVPVCCLTEDGSSYWPHTLYKKLSTIQWKSQRSQKVNGRSILFVWCFKHVSSRKFSKDWCCFANVHTPRITSKCCIEVLVIVTLLDWRAVCHFICQGSICILNVGALWWPFVFLSEQRDSNTFQLILINFLFVVVLGRNC